MRNRLVTSADWEARLAGIPKATREQKDAAVKKIMDADPSSSKTAALHKLGQGMVGPILIKLRYEGFARGVLVEDTLDKGPLQPYDVLDDLGQAYVLNQVDAEVPITAFEGKQVYPFLFRLAAFPMVRKEELYYMRADVVEHAQDETRQAIQKQEDARMLTLLASAITDYASETTHVVTPDHIVEIGVGNPLDVVDFYDLISRIELHEIEAKNILINPADARDLYTWDPNVTGWQFKDRVFAGGEITEFGEFRLQKSIMVPRGTVFLTPEPNYLGVMPIMYSLDVEENNQIAQFHRGWVMDEMIGMMVLNPRGLGAVKKI